MNQAIKFILLSFLFNVSTSFPSDAKLRIAFVDLPPYSYLDKTGKESGLFIEYLKNIVRHLELEAEFIHLPHRRFISFIERGEVDMWIGQRGTKYNSSAALISKKPLFIMELKVYWKTGTADVSSFDDLHNKRLILVSSYAYGGNLPHFRENSQSVSFVINHENGFDELFRGTDKYFLGYKKVAEEAIKKYRIEGYQSVSLSKYEIYVKVSKDYPNAINIMGKVDQFLANESNELK